jgi:hypothetical protein
LSLNRGASVYRGSRLLSRSLKISALVRVTLVGANKLRDLTLTVLFVLAGNGIGCRVRFRKFKNERDGVELEIRIKVNY